MLSPSGCAMLVIMNPAGPVHSVVTVTGISTTEPSSTVQVTVTADPTGLIGLIGILVTVTDVGGGTSKIEASILMWL